MVGFVKLIALTYTDSFGASPFGKFAQAFKFPRLTKDIFYKKGHKIKKINENLLTKHDA